MTVRLATVHGRAMVLTGLEEEEPRGVDVAQASGGRFGPDVMSIYPVWDEFLVWARTLAPGTGEPVDRDALGNPAPRPVQVFAIGLNYADHASEAGMVGESMVPATFTKYPSSLSGPFDPVQLPGATVDWEAELVVVIGSGGSHVAEAEAWSRVAGLAVGQDFSERTVQTSGPAPQFSLGKSFPGFSPIGPWLVTPDELADPDDLEITCEVNGEQVQKSRTSAMVWSVPQLVASLSSVCPLLPGDIIFTGTPAGVGMARKPPRYLSPGDTVVTRIEGIGEISQGCLPAPERTEENERTPRTVEDSGRVGR